MNVKMAEEKEKCIKQYYVKNLKHRFNVIYPWQPISEVLFPNIWMPFFFKLGCCGYTALFWFPSAFTVPGGHTKQTWGTIPYTGEFSQEQWTLQCILIFHCFPGLCLVNFKISDKYFSISNFNTIKLQHVLANHQFFHLYSRVTFIEGNVPFMWNSWSHYHHIHHQKISTVWFVDERLQLHWSSFDQGQHIA